MTVEVDGPIAGGVPELRIARIVVQVDASADRALQGVVGEMTTHVDEQVGATRNLFELRPRESV